MAFSGIAADISSMFENLRIGDLLWANSGMGMGCCRFCISAERLEL